MEPLKTGDMVTLGEFNHTNYIVDMEESDKDEYYIIHSLTPNLFIKKPRIELTKAIIANPKEPVERMLLYSTKFNSYLDYETTATLDCLKLFFVVKGTLTAKQKNVLSGICGSIAAIYCNNDLAIAVRLVKENKALLDDFNNTWYSNFEDIFDGKKLTKTKRQRMSIFNICGFVLAQLES